MSREVHVQFCERVGVKLPCATHLVICCRPGKGAEASKAMTRIMEKIGLKVNEQKTKVVTPGESFDFLGYTIGRFYGKGGKPYIGTRPSRKALLRIMREIHEQTSSQWNASEPETRVAVLNQKLRGWAGYFDQGPVVEIYLRLQDYAERRLRRWLMRRRQQHGTGYRQYPDKFLYERLGLYRLPRSRADQSKAKVGKSEMRAGCGKAARPVRGAGTENGTKDENETPDLW